MTISIHPITAADIPQVVNCIQLAFASDPYANWAFDTRPGHFNRDRNFASLKAKCEWGMRNALFYVAKEEESGPTSPSLTPSANPDQHDERSSSSPGGGSNSPLVGVSMWLRPRDPTQPPTWSEWADDYLLWFKQGLNLLWYRGRGGLRTHRYWIWKREQAAAQSALWTDPQGYYFCNIVTVMPGQQGKGVGRKLVEIVTRHADEEGRKCYLESSREVPNVKIYEKLGFEVVKKMRCVDERDGEGCDLFCMIREPRESLSQSAEGEGGR